MDIGIGMGSAHTDMGPENPMLCHLHTRKPEKSLLSYSSSLSSAAIALRRPSAYEMRLIHTGKDCWFTQFINLKSNLFFFFETSSQAYIVIMTFQLFGHLSAQSK